MKEVLLIADSGSSKTDWALVGPEGPARLLRTQGLNPVHQSSETLLGVLEGELLPQLGGLWEGRESVGAGLRVRFYGAGCAGCWADVLAGVLRQVFPGALSVSAESDLLGAARALHGQGEGIACILGTGSNSCLFDGERIVANVPPLGYILGDEGSGAALGRLFLNALYKGRLDPALAEAFRQWSGLAYEDVIRKVYREPLANRFLAGISVFVGSHMDQPCVRSLVKENFSAFFSHNVDAYRRADVPIGAVGSVAFCYAGLLREVASEHGFHAVSVMKSPIDGLVAQAQQPD